MAAISIHPDNDDLLAVALGESADTAVRDHLRVCDGCSERVDDLRSKLGNFPDGEEATDPVRPAPEACRNGSPPGGAEGADEELGRVIGDYKLLEEIGRGGQGVVHRARQVHTNKEVALKLVNPDGRRFALRELAMAVNLDHDHLVRIYHVGEDADRLYFTMKLAENGSLDKKIEEYRLLAAPAMSREERRAVEGCKKEICRFMARIARAVHYLHEQGILHLDLKPGNILLDARGEPLVTDLGVARRVRDAAHGTAGNGAAMTEQGEDASAIGGTLGYMAPEQARGQTGPHRPGDVYALGAILYKLLTGRRPFEGTEEEVLAQTTDMERPAPAPSLYNPNLQAGSDLELICRKCLEKEPERRYATASDLADDLECCACGEETSVRRRSWAERVTRAVVEGINRKLALPGIARWGAIELWHAGLTLAVHCAFFAMIRTDQPPELLWCVLLTYYAVWWWMFLTYLYRRDPVDLAERHLALLYGGVFLAGVTLFWIYCPPFGSARAADLLAFYPPRTVVNGVAFLVVGRLFWGAYYLVGLAHFLVAALMPLRPDLSPLIYGVFAAVCTSLAAVDHIRAARRESAPS
jgi:serine/threonine-protein kinase